MDIVTAHDVSSVSRRRGVRSAAPDQDLSRLGAAFAGLHAALLAGDTSNTLFESLFVDSTSLVCAISTTTLG
jgi:hypothetical protein